jgi:hypothetical protein
VGRITVETHAHGGTEKRSNIYPEKITFEVVRLASKDEKTLDFNSCKI